MKIRTFTITVVAILAALFAFSGSGFAARGSAGGGDGAAPDLGDLIIFYRDADGVPIPSEEVQVEDPDGELVNGGLCQQPIAFNVSDEVGTLCPTSCLNENIETANVVNVDPYSCAVAVGCSACTQEVDFERTNVVRSPAAVFEAQLEDVVVNLATADCVTLDPAGRLVANRVDPISSEVLSSTIDSPLQNLAIYRQLMLTGSIGIGLPYASLLTTAARGIGVGSGKSGEVNVDMIAYINQILGLTERDGTHLNKIYMQYREEVQGEMVEVTKAFLDYGSYGYLRATNFSTTAPSLPRPAYIPAGGAEAGWFEYLGLVDDSDDTFVIKQGPILDAVFPGAIGGDLGFTAGNIGGFAQAADDTRAVINYMHNWPIPDAAVYASPVLCKTSNETAYDVSISDDSGLQVPVRMVDGMEEGREFIVTVANAGPDAATGTVTVTATSESGDYDEKWTFEFTLAAGASDSFTQVFTVNLGLRTNINWTATASAPDDANLNNNTVSATTSIQVISSGGGGTRR